MEKRNRNYILSAVAFLVCSVALIFWGFRGHRIILQPSIIEDEIWLFFGFVALIVGVYRLIVGLRIIKKIKTHKIVGTTMLCINAFLVYQPTFLLYSYIFQKGILRPFWIPKWMLATESLLAVTGIVISICLLKNKISILKAVLFQLLIIILIIGFNYFWELQRFFENIFST